MKTLYFVRHAKSDKENEKLEDIDRTLNAKGYSDAHAMASRLNDTRKRPQLIISSPAIRALTTALIFAGKFNYDPKEIILESLLYETGTKEYLQVIGNIDNKVESAMIFAHNPTITMLATKMTDPFTDQIPTCAVTAISFGVKDWKEVTISKGKLVLYDFPKNAQC